MKFTLTTETVQQNCIDYLLNVNLDGKTQVQFSAVKSKRGRVQNDLYWVWMTYLQDEIGETKENLHFYFKHRFLKKDDLCVLGEYVPVEITTTKLTVKEFADYLTSIELFVIDKMGYNFPVCDDYKTVFRKETK